MPNNVFANTPGILVATEDISFVAAGLTPSNTHIIYKVGSPLKSYIPGRTINSITGFESGAGYYMIPKINMDLTLFAIPPLDTYYLNYTA
jgi:hypothetical protein